MDIHSDEITYEVTRRYDISGVEPVKQWGGPLMLTPSTVTVRWSWTGTGELSRSVRVFGRRMRKNGTAANMPEAEIYSFNRYEPCAWPDWLRGLADQRPALVPTDMAIEP